MSGIEPITLGQLAPLAYSANMETSEKMVGSVSMDKAIEAAFIEFMANELDFSKIGSVLSDEDSFSGDSLLMNQMLLGLLVNRDS